MAGGEGGRPWATAEVRGEVLRSELESGHEVGGGEVDAIPSGRENGCDSELVEYVGRGVRRGTLPTS